MVEVQRQTRTYSSPTSMSVGLLSDATGGCNADSSQTIFTPSDGQILLTKVRVMTQTMT